MEIITILLLELTMFVPAGAVQDASQSSSQSRPVLWSSLQTAWPTQIHEGPMPDQPPYPEVQIEQWQLTCCNEELQLCTEELQRKLRQERNHFDRTSKKLHAQLKLRKTRLRQAQGVQNNEHDKLLVADSREQRLERGNKDMRLANAVLCKELTRGVKKQPHQRYE